MTFARKIFIAVFLSTLIVGTCLICGAYKYVENRAEQDFIARYKVFTRILGDTLTRLDLNTEALMLNAAQVVAGEDKEKGLLSNHQLRLLQAKLGITHLFIIDKNGKFLRSTNDKASLIPNLFSFSPIYRKLLTGAIEVEATPVIKPNPEPKPFKFLSIANFNRSRIIEVGVRVDFIANTLAEAISSDKNVLKMSLFGPDGTSFGTFSPSKVLFDDRNTNLPAELNSAVDHLAETKFYAKVKSSHIRCAQCDVAGTSRDGEYYYVLESSISKSELIAIKSKATLVALFMIFANALLAFLLARILSKRLVKNIERAVSRVRKIKANPSMGGRIDLDVRDEVSFLTTEFDRLLDSLEESQNKLVEAEKIEAKVELARIVAHNIKSPILAIEMMIPGLISVPVRTLNVLRSAVKEIKLLSEKLKTQADSMLIDTAIDSATELIFLPALIDCLVQRKALEFRVNKKVVIDSITSPYIGKLFTKANSIELKSVISNIINNAIESYGTAGGLITVELISEKLSCRIRVSDNGAGIPASYLPDIGLRNISFKGEASRGLGLTHAFSRVENWGGKIAINSKVGVGTSVDICLPLYCENKV